MSCCFMLCRVRFCDRLRLRRMTSTNPPSSCVSEASRRISLTAIWSLLAIGMDQGAQSKAKLCAPYVLIPPRDQLLCQNGGLVIIGDRHGALTLGAANLGWRGIRTHQDPLLGQRALDRNAKRLGFTDAYTSHALDESLLTGARVVLLQLPRGLDALDEIAWAIARWAAPDVRVYAGGRVKHMTLAQNEVLARYFGEVTAGLAHRKSRVITASVPTTDLGPSPWPKWGRDPELPFALAAHGATFGGPKLDHGTRLLLNTFADSTALPPLHSASSEHKWLSQSAGDDHLRSLDDEESAPTGPRRIVDLGCGNGSLAVWAALRWPEARVLATDQSAAAVAATRATAEAAGVLARIEVHRADATEAVPDGWAELMMLNPPFHSGSTVHAGVAHRLIRSCARALAPGGELRLVFNSHLRYRPLVEREIGPTRQLARDKTFTVLAARSDR